MASSSNRSVTESIRDDFLTCHICFEVFTDPRILPCLHTYCFQCICSHVDTAQSDKRNVVCPECREPITETVRSLKTNFFINGLTEVVKEKSTENVPCTTCLLHETESKAKVKCLDCGDYLCSSCSDGHNASSLTWKHEKIPLYDIKQGTYDQKLRQLQRIKCSIHEDKDVEYYCKSCLKSVCLTCVLLDHRDHKCTTISEAVCEKKSNIIGLTEKLREKLMVFVKEENMVTLKSETLAEKGKKEEMEIEKKAEQEIARINDIKKIALKKVTSKTKTGMNEYNRQLEVLRLQKSLVSSCINFSDNILKKGKDEEVLLLEAMVTERLLHLQAMDKEVISENSEQRNESKQKSETIACNHVETNSKQDDDRGKEDMFTDVKEEGDREVIYCRGQSIYSARTGNDNDKKNTTTTLKKAEVDIAKVKVYFKKQNKFSTKYANDFEKPDVKGMIYSPTVGLIIADKRNKKIKIVNKTGSLEREITTAGFQPFAVAVAWDIIGAVSEDCLFLFTSTGTLKTRVRITEKKSNQGLRFTYSLAASKNLGFVVGNIPNAKKLNIYSQDGFLTKQLDCSLALPLAALSITPSGDIVLSEWGSGRIRVISRDGKPRFSVTESGWKPNGTCVSKDGIIFVAEYLNQSVGVYSPRGDHCLDFMTKSGGVKNPVCVAIDENDLLYVTGNAGKLCVYEVITVGKKRLYEKNQANLTESKTSTQ